MQYNEFVRNQMNKELEGNDKMHVCIYGIFGEMGEVVELLKKHYFQKHSLDKKEVIKEMGDVLFYFVELCNQMDVDIEYLMEENIKKLKERYPNGFKPKDSIERKE